MLSPKVQAMRGSNKYVFNLGLKEEGEQIMSKIWTFIYKRAETNRPNKKQLHTKG